jgi:hypothetical protein
MTNAANVSAPQDFALSLVNKPLISDRRLSMPWHKVTFTEEEVEDGAPGRFEKAFRQIYQDAHSPKDAALFSSEIAAEGIGYFLSPEAAALAGSLLAAYTHAPSDKPDRDDVRLALGRRGVEKSLL